MATEHLDSTDLANGMILTLLKNIRPDAEETKVSMVAITPKPSLVKLAIAALDAISSYTDRECSN